MPHWVTNGAGNAPLGDAYGGKATIVFAARRTIDLPSLGRAGVEENKFRPTIHDDSSRCLMPWQLASAFDDIDVALSSAQRFVDALTKEHTVLFNAEGMSAGMKRALGAMSECSNWEHLTVKAATGHQVREF